MLVGKAAYGSSIVGSLQMKDTALVALPGRLPEANSVEMPDANPWENAPSMKDTAQAGYILDNIRSDLLDQLLFLYFVYGFLVLVVAVNLGLNYGWTLFAVIQALTAIVLMLLMVFRRRFSIEFKGHMLAVCFTTLGVNSLMFSGLAGRGTLLLLLACLIACFSLNLRQGQISAALGAIILVVVGYFQYTGAMPVLVPDAGEMLNQSNWINTSVFYLFMAASLLIMLSRFQQLTETLLESQQRDTVRLAAATAEAERANLAKTEFLSRMSHELRTPLNAILGFTELMQLEKKYEGDGRLDNIRVAGEHLLVLINEVLDLMGIEEGHLTLATDTVDLEPIFEECNLLVAGRAGAENITLQHSVVDGPMLLAGDGLRIKQVLLNLLSNAVKYNQPGGSVTLVARRLDAQWAEIDIVDTGIGIAEEDFDSVFEPFTRFGSRKMDVDGTGVGLTISRQLVELMGGSLEFTSKVGEGTTFTVKLPLAC